MISSIHVILLLFLFFNKDIFQLKLPDFQTTTLQNYQTTNYLLFLWLSCMGTVAQQMISTIHETNLLFISMKITWLQNYNKGEIIIFKWFLIGLLPFSNVQFFVSAVFRWDLTKCKLINENFFFDVWRYNVCLLKPDYVNMMI